MKRFYLLPFLLLLVLSFPHSASCFFIPDDRSVSSQQGFPTAVPEPATMLLMGTGVAALAAKLRRRHKASKQ